MFQAFRRDADAAVVHRAGQPQYVVIESLPLQAEMDGAFLGELQRITQQIHQDLSDPRRIAADLDILQAGLDLQFQRQSALLGAVLEHQGGALHQFQQVEGDALQFQRAAFDP
ncbi:hypothetical protein PAERUG_P5_London_26_VIM_2_01_09_02392 [Pseudomonas aeruginosa]|nr:hypothetical protein PAERUG_P5_London_26_VIM_2_01_09_02392 [Pseudomonas aeruginosa]